MQELKRVSPGEEKNLKQLSIYDPNVCKKATHFSLTPDSKQYPAALYGALWEEVIYFTDKDDLDAFPLMQLLDEWNTRSDKDN